MQFALICLKIRIYSVRTARSGKKITSRRWANMICMYMRIVKRGGQSFRAQLMGIPGTLQYTIES